MELSPAARQRIQLHLWLLPVYAWILFAWPAYFSDLSASGRLDRSGHIKGHDFAHFYVLGQIGADRATADLYSFDRQGTRTDTLVSAYENRFQPVYGPQVAMAFAPLALLPYDTAVVVWLILSAAVYFLCCLALWRALPALRPCGSTVAVLAVGMPAFFAVIASGQTSTFALGCFTLGYFALKGDRPWLAGLALGLLAYKPSLALVLPFAVIAARQWTVIFGAVVSVTVQVAVAGLYFGTGILADYAGVFPAIVPMDSVINPDLYAMHSLRSFFAALVSSVTAAEILYAATAVLTVVVAVRAWKSTLPLDGRYAILLLASVLVDPHVNIYDLVVLVPAFFFVAAWLADRRSADLTMWLVLYLAYYLPALAGLARLSSVQFSVAAFFALLLWFDRRIRDDRRGAAA